MFLKAKRKIEKELSGYIKELNRLYSLKSVSGVLFNNIKEFLLRKGKRIRPILFTIGYLGFAKKQASGMYRSAISLELLHDFMLVHDDIIDKSETRRGKPSMHHMLNSYLAKYKELKFNGQDLTIVAGDVMFAMALDTFLAIREEPRRKESALRKLISAALYTGSGEFIELLSGTTGIDEVTKDDIYRIYDLKTANYTFASPLTIGATLAGASSGELDKLFKYGIFVGRAFQIKDDIIGTFGKESETGKSNLTDIKEGKKTLLVWYAYHHCGKKEKALIKKLFSKKTIASADFLKIRRIIYGSGAVDYAKKQIQSFIAQAEKNIIKSKLSSRYKEPLHDYINSILEI